LSSAAFRDLARRNPQDFTRDRDLPLPRLIAMMLNFRKGTIEDELDQFFETLSGQQLAPSVTPAAFCKARQKLDPSAFLALNQALLDSTHRHLPQRLWHGMRLLAVDGSTARLPDTDPIRATFGGPGDSRVPMARFSRLYDVLNEQVVWADMDPYASAERDLAALYLLRLGADDLVLYDRGYPAFWLLAYHMEEQRQFCARAKLDFHPQVEAFVASKARSKVVVLKPSDKSATQCKAYDIDSRPMTVRLVRVDLKGGETEVLITSLVDKQAFPSRWFAKLYHLRWGVEENYKREKSRLEIENFSGRTVLSVRQDFYAKIVALNIASVFSNLAQWLVDERHGERRRAYRVNFANALSKMKNNLVRLLLDAVTADIGWRLVEKMALCTEAVRPNRSFPRDPRKVHVKEFHGNYKRTR